MSSQSPQEFREAVRGHTDIVGLIGETVALQARSGGRQHVGLCPFHDDTNPSLNVYPDRQTFRCWSCDTGGDVFTFVMKRENVTFPEALEILARRANLEMPRTVTGRSPEQESNRARVFEVLQWAENEFHRTLLESPAAEPARQYLADRGFSDEMIRLFRIGFHPDNWSWLLNRAQGKYSNQLLSDARLIGTREDGSAYDNFVNRVLFPIHNERGQTVSFGGRILPGSQDSRKYWNGPESVVFHKSRLLYGLDKARETIRETNCAIVVEGYTDCLAFHQHGIRNVVCTLGTALTDSHVTVLKRFARQVVLVYDGDDAGQRAANRAVEMFLAQDVDLRILTLPDGQDPDEFLAAHGADEFNRLSGGALEAWEFRFQKARRQFGLDSIDGRQRVLEEMIHVLAQVPRLSESLRENLLIANLAQRLAVVEDSVREQLKAARSRGIVKFQAETDAAPNLKHDERVRRIVSGRLTRDEKIGMRLARNPAGGSEIDPTGRTGTQRHSAPQPRIPSDSARGLSGIRRPWSADVLQPDGPAGRPRAEESARLDR